MLIFGLTNIMMARPDGGIGPGDDRLGEGRYTWHTNIVATTFWVGDIFDPNADDGSQVSAYDDNWLASYGGCDGIWIGDRCHTERRHPDNGWFPRSMTPLQNPFYIGLPYDDINDDRAFATRSKHIPWAGEQPYASRIDDQSFSFMKDRWVEIRRGDLVCFGQIEDAGPGKYDDFRYVFSRTDVRPANKRHNGAGMDVSPAINGCLHFADLKGEDDRIDWRFVDSDSVPAGPWKEVVTRTKH